MCSIGSWVCPYKNSYDYYVKINACGEIIETSLKNDFKNIDGFKIETRNYNGCPKFNNKQESSKKDSFLDWFFRELLLS